MISFSNHFASFSSENEELSIEEFPFHFLRIETGIWSFPLTTSQSDDSVYKLAVSDFEHFSLCALFVVLETK